MSVADVPSSTVTAVSQVIVVAEIVPRMSAMSYVFASVARNTYEVPPMLLYATEKFAVLYDCVPREVHVEPSLEDAYSIADPL